MCPTFIKSKGKFAKKIINTTALSLLTIICVMGIYGWGTNATFFQLLFASSEKIKPIKQPTPATGPLQIHPENPRYFANDNGQLVYLSGSHTWTNLQDLGFSDPPPEFDYVAYMDWMQARNYNFMRLWAWESAKGAPWASDEYWFTPLPYERSGPGIALDGKPKFDLTRFNQAYFDRLRARVVEAGDRGIYVAVMLFGGWSIDKKGLDGGNPWPGHPFNSNNNINSIDGDLNGDNEGHEVHTLQDPAITALQEAYVRKTIDTLNDLDNVLWEISNESHNQSQDWQYHIINYVKSYEAKKPNQHPVGMTVEYPDGSNDDLFASPADWISPRAVNGDQFEEIPPATGNKVIIHDTDHYWGIGGTQSWIWKSFLRGYNPIFMDPYNGVVLPSEPFDPQWEPIRQAMEYAAIYANRINLAAMTPHSNLSTTEYCLANPGSEYLIYTPNGEQITVDLSAASGELAIEWFNPNDGTVFNGGTTTGGAHQSFNAPFYGEAILYIWDATSLAVTSRSVNNPIQKN